MRFLLPLALLPLVLLVPGCKVFDQPKRVDGLEQRVDELADAVTRLTGEPVGQRPKKAAKGHGDEEADGEGEREAKGKGKDDGKGERKARRSAKADTSRGRSRRDDATDDKDGKDAHADKASAHARDADAHDAAGEAAPPSGPPPHWSYAGADGPEHWGELDAQFATCGAGHEQSPIDILPRRRGDDDDESVFFVYHPTDAKVTDTGHTLQVDLAPGSFAVIDGARFDLVQFHVHTPSEHTLAGDAFAMEVHLVHRNKAGALAVVGVLFAEGAPSPALAAVWKQTPKAGATAALKRAFDPSTLLPSDTAAYRYSGSLTTPPCSEGVRWIVLRRTATDAAARIAAFQARFGANARPAQELGDRTID